MDGYKNSIVVFLDILGFKKKVENEKFEKIFNTLKYITAWNSCNGVNNFTPEKLFCYEDYLKDKGIDEEKICKDIKSDLKVSVFSDSMVIALPYTEDDFEVRFFMIVCFVSYLMGKLAMSNYFLRGGIAIGEMFNDDNIFFGKAFLEAYSLEQIAVYPRVILSKKIEEKLKEKMPYIQKCEDGLFCVDFLNFVKKMENTRTSINMELEPIKNLVNENIVKSDKELRIRQKYEWLKRQM